MTCGQIMYMLLHFDPQWKPPWAYHCLKCILLKQQARDTTLGFNNDFMNQKLLSHEIDRTWGWGGDLLRGLVEVASWVIWKLEGSLSAIILGKRTCPLCHVIPRSQLRCVLYDLSSTVFIPATRHTTSLLKSLINVKLHVMCFPPLSSLCVLWSCGPMTDPSALSSSPVGIGWA